MKKIIKVISGLLACAVFIASCNQYDSNNEVQCAVDAIQLENLHQTVKTNLVMAKNESTTIETKSLLADDLEVELNENLKYLNQQGMEALFDKKGLDTEIISEVEFLVENQNSSTIYQDLIDHFNIENEDEAAMLFTIFETHNLLIQQNALVTKSGMMEMKGISFGCAIAIASAVTVTAGAAFVTGGASLIIFLVGKGLATAAIIDACS